MSTHSTREDQSDREDAVNDMVKYLHNESSITDEDVAEVFNWIWGEFILYERFGYMTIADTIQDEIDNNGTHKAVLISYVDAPTNTVTLQQKINEYII